MNLFLDYQLNHYALKMIFRKCTTLEEIMAQGFRDSGKTVQGYPIYKSGCRTIVYDPVNDEKVIKFKVTEDGSYELEGS